MFLSLSNIRYTTLLLTFSYRWRYRQIVVAITFKTLWVCSIEIVSSRDKLSSFQWCFKFLFQEWTSRMVIFTSENSIVLEEWGILIEEQLQEELTRYFKESPTKMFQIHFKSFLYPIAFFIFFLKVFFISKVARFLIYESKIWLALVTIFFHCSSNRRSSHSKNESSSKQSRSVLLLH